MAGSRKCQCSDVPNGVKPFREGNRNEREGGIGHFINQGSFGWFRAESLSNATWHHVPRWLHYNPITCQSKHPLSWFIRVL